MSLFTCCAKRVHVVAAVNNKNGLNLNTSFRPCKVFAWPSGDFDPNTVVSLGEHLKFKD